MNQQEQIKITDADFDFKSSYDHTAKIIYKGIDYSLDYYNLILEKKNILDGAKVSDICRHRDDKYSQIVDMRNELYICKFYCQFPYNISLHIDGVYSHDKSESGYDVVGYEPLSDDGSFDWSVQMMKLGLSVTGHTNIPGYRINMHSGRIIESYNFEMPVSHSIENWTDRFKCMKNWKLYNPLLSDAKLGCICERVDGKFVQISNIAFNGCDKYFIADSNRYDIHGKSDKGHPLNLISCEPLALEGTLTWAVQMMKMGASVLGYGGKFTYTDGRIFTTGGCIYSTSIENFIYQMSADYSVGWEIFEPQSQKFKIGDYVEVEYDGDLHYYKVIKTNEQRDTLSIGFNGMFRTIHSDGSINMVGIKLIRKISPHDVVLNFGNGVKGTIKISGDRSDMIQVYGAGERFYMAKLMIDKLTEPMKSLVLELLKAQMEFNTSNDSLNAY